MTVPGRAEAAHLLLSLDPPWWLVRHSRAVAEIADWLAQRTIACGTVVDRALVDAAALLHDVDKAIPADDPAAALPHGHGSAAWLTARGHGELASAIAAHPVPRLLDCEWFDDWLETATPEDRIVAYADKRAGQQLEPMADRFASWRHRYPRIDVDGRTLGWDDHAFQAVRERAVRLEVSVCAVAGVRPADVRRMGWTSHAFAAVGSVGAPPS